MMYNTTYGEEQIDSGQPLGWKDRIKQFFGLGTLGPEDADDVAEEPYPPQEQRVAHPVLATTEVPPQMSPRNTTTFRVPTVREASIAILPASTFAHAQKAADRLKEGEAQIINLEGTPPEMSRRLIDFLSGVIYALGGEVERISEGAYLFTPDSVRINADKPAEPTKSIFDRL